MTLHDEIAYLDMLAAQLHARGWTAYVAHPGRAGGGPLGARPA